MRIDYHQINLCCISNTNGHSLCTKIQKSCYNLSLTNILVSIKILHVILCISLKNRGEVLFYSQQKEYLLCLPTFDINSLVAFLIDV